MKTVAAIALLTSSLAVSACQEKATLDRSRVEMVTVEGRRFEVRIAPTGVPDEFRMLVVRATLVVNPDPDLESERNWNVARQFMDRTCRGQPYKILDNTLIDDVNLQIRFACTVG
jgi:hypothetical protein